MRVIYIAGTSHSGSTLLDLMLNAHPAIVSIGEVRQKLKLEKLDAFWSRVNQRTQEVAGKSLPQLDMSDYRDLDERSAPNAVVFRAISEVSGKSFIVDSSKRHERMSYLMQLKELDVYPIHLVRSPKGQIASMVRKHGGFLNHILSYEQVHERIRRKLKSVPHSIVRYEDLVRQPERTLTSILGPLGLTFHPQQLSWAEQPKHLIGGNRMRRRRTSELVLDQNWKRSLSLAQKLAIDICTIRSRLLNAQTGYFPGSSSAKGWIGKSHTKTEPLGMQG